MPIYILQREKQKKDRDYGIKCINGLYIPTRKQRYT